MEYPEYITLNLQESDLEGEYYNKKDCAGARALRRLFPEQKCEFYAMSGSVDEVAYEVTGYVMNDVTLSDSGFNSIDFRLLKDLFEQYGNKITATIYLKKI